MPSIPLKQKCLGIILILVIVFQEVVVSTKGKKNIFFFFTLKDMVLGKKGGHFGLGMGSLFGL